MKKLLFAAIFAGSLQIQAAETINKPPEKAALCSACHGEQGNSVNPEWPNLAGQHASYLVKELQDYKVGKTRSAPTMAAIVAGLDEQDMLVLAQYYAQLPRKEGVVAEKYVKRGEQLYRGGDFDKKISACIACHGPHGTGNGPAKFPVLSGQNALYTIQQLQAFKEGKRSNDLNAIMRDISSRMSQEDMEAVAHYVEGLY